MAERLPSPTTLRTQAGHHREEASKTADADKRRVRLTVAQEYEKLARAIEAELGLAQPSRDSVTP